jgi:hypothetical protein
MRSLPSGHCGAAAAGENLPAEQPLPLRKRSPEPRQSTHALAGGEAEGYRVVFNRYRNQVEMGHVGRIDYYRRFGLVNDFTGIVVGWSEVPAKGQVTLVLIGPSP